MNCIIITKKYTKKYDYTKLILANDYLYDSEEEDKETDKKPDQTEPPKKPGINDVKKFTNLINKEDKRFFSFQRPSAMLKAVYNADNEKKNRDLINVIKSVLSDLMDEI